MRKTVCSILTLALLLPAAALAAMTGAPMVEGTPVKLQCGSAILAECRSGQVIFADNADEMRPVASVTKLMTILLALEALDDGRAAPDDCVTVSKNASGMGGSQILLDTGETQTYSQLLKSVIVCSANDSAVALAEYLYGSEELFVARMNERARDLGPERTQLRNCTGLPVADQHTTARDVAVIAAEVFAHPLYFTYSGVWLENFDHSDGRVTQMTNTNKLIRLYDGCDGGKTGSTDEAGYCLAATAEKNGMRLIAVVLGGTSSTARFDSAAAMFDFGFANYRLYPVAERGTPVKGGLPVNGGETDLVPLMLDGELTLLIEKGGEDAVQLVPDPPEALDAPVEQGQRVGCVNVSMDGKQVASLDVVAAQSVKATGLLYLLKRIFVLWCA